MSTKKAKPFYPLFIHYQAHIWINPNIEKYLIWDTDNSMSNGSNWSYENVYRIFFKSNKDDLHIVFYTENDLDDDDPETVAAMSKSLWSMIRKYSVIWGGTIHDINWISPDVGIEKDVDEKGRISYSWSS